MKTAKKKSGVDGASREAKRTAAVILEVLSGTLQTKEAAEALGVSTSRYYLLESRALEGLLSACEPRAKGYVRTPEKELEALRKELAKQERERGRLQALVRASQRTVGLSVPRKKTGTVQGGDGKGTKTRKRRKPPARALLIAKKLREGDETGAAGLVTAGAGKSPARRVTRPATGPVVGPVEIERGVRDGKAAERTPPGPGA